MGVMVYTHSLVSHMTSERKPLSATLTVFKRRLSFSFASFIWSFFTLFFCFIRSTSNGLTSTVQLKIVFEMNGFPPPCFSCQCIYFVHFLCSSSSAAKHSLDVTLMDNAACTQRWRLESHLAIIRGTVFVLSLPSSTSLIFCHKSQWNERRTGRTTARCPSTLIWFPFFFSVKGEKSGTVVFVS